jgi:sodium/bile acid cotransporter 7
MAAVLSHAAQLGTIILPLMIFHQLQLIARAILARGDGRRSEWRSDGAYAAAAQ